MSDGPLAIQKSGFFHSVRDVVAAFNPERRCRAPVVFSFCERQTAFKLNDPRYFLASGVVMRQGNDRTLVTNKRPDAVFVFSAILDMSDRARRYILKTEFAFIRDNERLDD